MKNKVKPGGLLYVAVKVPTGGKKEGILHENGYGYEYERFFSYFTLEEIEDYFKQLGFKIISSSATLFGKTTWVQVIGQLG